MFLEEFFFIVDVELGVIYLKGEILKNWICCGKIFLVIIDFSW